MEPIIFRPFSWSHVLSRSNNISDSYQAFGYTIDDEPIYVRISAINSYLFKYDDETLDLSDFEEVFNPEILTVDPNTKLVSMVNPALDISHIEHDYLLGTTDTEFTKNIESSHSSVANQSILGNWQNAVKNPYGSLFELFRVADFQPYNWIKISKYSNLPGNYTTANIEITTDYYNMEQIDVVSNDGDMIDIIPRRSHWDLEVYSSTGAFPDAGISGDVIFMASLAYSGPSSSGNEINANYLLHLGKIDSSKSSSTSSSSSSSSSSNSQLTGLDENMIMVERKNEESLIQSFMSTYRDKLIDRSYTYNGISFDDNYIANRVYNLHYKLPPVSKILGLSTKFVERQYVGLFKSEMARGPLLPGVEQIDLLYYFRRFHPGLRNYKLDTVGKMFIGEGKTGLTIDELNDAYTKNDSKRLRIGAEYGMVDSILLRKLQKKLNIDARLEALANVTGILIPDLLRLSDLELANRIVYRVDFNHYFSLRRPRKFAYTIKQAPGVYNNVHFYDYSALYIQALSLIEDELTIGLIPLLKVAYPKLRSIVYHLKLIDPYILNKALLHVLSDYQGDNIIYRNDNIMRSIGSVKSPTKFELILTNRVDYIYSFTDSSYITITMSDSDKSSPEIVKHGRSEVCNPKFPYVTDMVDRYLLAKLKLGPSLPASVNMSENIPIDQLIGRQKIRDKYTYGTRNSIGKTLAQQYTKQIKTWTIVPWLHTNHGPLLLERWENIKAGRDTIKAVTIDYGAYAQNVNKLFRIIDKLPVNIKSNFS